MNDLTWLGLLEISRALHQLRFVKWSFLCWPPFACYQATFPALDNVAMRVDLHAGVWSAREKRKSCSWLRYFSRAPNSCVPFSSSEAKIFLVSAMNRDLWPHPIFWTCAEYSFCILSQSEFAILGADQNDRALWGRVCIAQPKLTSNSLLQRAGNASWYSVVFNVVSPNKLSRGSFTEVRLTDKTVRFFHDCAPEILHLKIRKWPPWDKRVSSCIKRNYHDL